MRILVYGINYAPELTGIGKYTYEMSEWLTSRGHEVRVITAPPYYPFWSVQPPYSSWYYFTETKKKIKIFRCPLYIPGKPTGFKRLIHLMSFAVSSLPVLIWQALSWKPVLIWAVEPPLFCAPAALLVSRLIRLKSWLHIQDFEVDAAIALGLLPAKKMERFIRWFETKIMCGFDRVSTISEKMLIQLDNKGVKPEKKVKFQNWVNTFEIYPIKSANQFRKEFNISGEEVVLLYSGNFGEKQGLEIIIEAARKLQDHQYIRFILCGEGAALARMLRLAEGLNNIQFLPLQPFERLNELLNLADIHLLPQRSGISDLVLPSKVTGMLASGRPVIATAPSGTELACTIKDCGLLVSPGDVEAFVRAIIHLAYNPSIRSEMGIQARSYAISHWDQNKVLGDFEKEILNLVER